MMVAFEDVSPASIRWNPMAILGGIDVKRIIHPRFLQQKKPKRSKRMTLTGPKRHVFLISVE